MIDYRALHLMTKQNNFPVPRTKEMLKRLGIAKYYCKLDLKTEFHWIQIALRNIKKTAIRTNLWALQTSLDANGPQKRPSQFKALLDSIFYDSFYKFKVIYLDDILIYSNSIQDHIRDFRLALQRLEDNDLYVGKSKYKLMTTKRKFLGLHVGRIGISVGADRNQIIREWPRPKNLTKLRSSIGLLQFLRRLNQDFARVATPLTNLTRKGRSLANFDLSCDIAFRTVKEKLINVPIVRALNWRLPFRCHLEASQLAVDGALTQIGEWGEYAVSYFSKRLSPAKENFPLATKRF